MSKLPIRSNEYTEINITFDLGVILDGYSKYVKENEINNDELFEFYQKENTQIIIEQLIYNCKEQYRSIHYKKPIATYYILTDKALYKSDGISSLILLCNINNKLLKDIIKFLEKETTQSGFELYEAINILDTLKERKKQ